MSESSVSATDIMDEDQLSSRSTDSTTKALCGSTPSDSFSNSTSADSPQRGFSPIRSGPPQLPPDITPTQRTYFPGLPAGSITYPSGQLVPPQRYFTHDGLYPTQTTDPYGTVPPPEFPTPESQANSTPQPYANTRRSRRLAPAPSSRNTRLQLEPLLTTPTLKHNYSIEYFETDTPPWSPETESHPGSHHAHRRDIPTIPGLDNSPAYQPPYDDKLGSALKRMSRTRAGTTRGGGGANESGRGKAKGKRRATSPAEVRDRLKKERRGGNGDGDEGQGQGGRRDQESQGFKV